MAEKKKILYIVEAMGGGVFVSNVIGNRDVIHNNENGFVCSDTEKFVKAIRESQSGAERFTAQAYQDVLEKYNTKAMAKQYSEKYDEAINIGGGYSMGLLIVCISQAGSMIR